MDVANKNIYYNSIYKAMVVNTDDSSNSVQIFVPITMGQYTKYVQDYMNDDNKENSKYKNYFPWAVSLIEDLEIGDVVYGSYIDNRITDMIIIGKSNDGGNFLTSSMSGSINNIDGSNLVNLLMPILVENEVGIPRNKWPSGFDESLYGKFTPNDNFKGWSIGVIQWHNSRAFRLLYEIAKADSNWLNRWSDTSLGIVSDLKGALDAGSSSRYESKWCIPVYDSLIKTGTVNMLTSDIGKKTQISVAYNDGLDYINTVKNSYGITNPAVIIFIADIINQYGSINSNEAQSIRNIIAGKTGTMNQFEAVVTWWNNYKNGAYKTRRNNTAEYIRNLEKSGKLNETDLTNLAGSANLGGQYLWPAPNCQNVSQVYKGATHTGVDLTTGKGDSTGEAVIAIANGTVTCLQSGYTNAQGSTNMASYGNMIVINFNNGHAAVYAHLSAILVKKGDTVTAGQVVGKVGNTGNSYGAHLHFEFRTGVVNGQGYGGSHVNPLPYIRKN